MLILSRVCAEFHDASGAVLFTVTPETRLTFQEAPEAIRQDPLFNLLRNDHSIEVSDDGPRKKLLEQDPLLPPEAEKEPVQEPAASASDAEKPADPKSSGRKTAKP